MRNLAPRRCKARDPKQIRWMELVTQRGGVHHGYFLPTEGASDVAYALFSFPRLAEYERYRESFGVDPEFIEADRIRESRAA